MIFAKKFYATARLILTAGALLAGAADAEAASARPMDTERSMLTVKVYKTGLFSGFAHDHVIQAPIAQGWFDEQNPAVELTVETRQLKVVDPEGSDKDRAEVQRTMLGPKVMDRQSFPEIRFRSTQVEAKADNQWTVRGDLTLHGQTRPVTVNVEYRKGRYWGSAALKQRDFGIVPVSVAGGTVKVKDEVRVEFEVVGR